jgi:hypothetical protein
VIITQIQPVKIDFNLPQGDHRNCKTGMREDQLTVGVSGARMPWRQRETFRSVRS